MFGSRNFLFAKTAGPFIFGGKLFMWGFNSSGQLGQSDTTSRSSPVQVGALTNWSALATGQHTIATKNNGQLWSWGSGSNGGLGLGNTVSLSSPVQVGALTNWLTPKISPRFTTCLKTDGTLWSWGYNYNGQLGTGNTIYRSSPVQVGSSTNWYKVSAGYKFVLATESNGKLFAWGQNSYGQLGQNDTTSRSSPVQIGALTNWKTPFSAPAFGNQSLCVKTDGTLWAWGNGGSGQLGLGDTISRSSPVQVGALTTWDIPEGGAQFSLCTKTDGTLWAWGQGSDGRLGLGNTTSYSSPKQVGALTNWSKPAAGLSFSTCTTTDGKLFTWGQGSDGKLGLNNTTDFSSPVQVGSLTTWAVPDAGQSSTGCIQGVATAAPVNLTLPVVSGVAQEGEILSSTTGTWDQFPSSFAYQWQRGTSNIGGATSSTYLIAAADVGSTLRCVVTATNSIGATAANSANTATVIAYVGKLFSWGTNSAGALGIDIGTSYTNRSSPVQIGADTLWSSNRKTALFTLAVKTNGQLWSWGYNGYGMLGIGTNTNRSSPVQVGALTDWATPGGGDNFSSCVKTDGTLWTWGFNNYGQLGHGDTINRSSPVQVGALTNWKTPLMGSGSIRFSLCSKTDGTLWSWGRNDYGQLGLGNLTNYSSPKQVGALTTWKTPVGGVGTNNSWVVCSKTDGTLWSWGRNNQGQLGLNNLTDYSSPKQIGTLTNWVTPAGGTVFTLCTKTDGTLWAWGYNGFGQLGQNSSFPGGISSPSQVGTLTNWKTPAAGNGVSTCVKTDGTLWAWGAGDNGSLGLNNTTRYSSPKQVGALTSWLAPSVTARTVNCTQR
jgi:alpha-tubulin suppressor-like RCC1 family protein